MRWLKIISFVLGLICIADTFPIAKDTPMMAGDKSTAVTARVGNGYVAADVDLNGDDGNFEQGGDPTGSGSYLKLTFGWPGDPDPPTQWMIFYVDGVWSKTQIHPWSGDAATVMPASDTQYVVSSESTVVVEWWDWNGVRIKLKHRPVSLGLAPGDIEQIEHRIIMRSIDGGTHQCGAMIYYDTMIDINDGAPVSTSFGYNSNSSIFFAPGIPTLWRAYSGGYPPAPGDLRALGVLVGYEATMPDVFWYGQCWNPSDPTYHSIAFGWDDAEWVASTGAPYDDSAAMVKWYARTVPPGDSVVFVNYFGIGNFDTTSVTLFHETPIFTYDCDGTMNPDTVHFTFMITNGSTDSICDVVATLSGTGFNIVSSENPDSIGTMAGYGGSYNVDWGVMFDPAVWGTTQDYIITISLSNCYGYDSTFSDTYSVYIPHPSDISLSVSVDDTLLCVGDSVQLHASFSGTVGSTTFQWMPDEAISDIYSTDPWVYPDHNTPYTFSITDENGCNTFAGVIIYVSNLVVDAGSSFVVCEGDSVQIGGIPTASGGIGTYTYNWSPSDGLSDTNAANPFAQPTTPMWYFVTVTDDAGCSASDSVFVNLSGTPYAYPYLPDVCGGTITCNPPQFQFVVNDTTVGIDEDSTLVWINGVLYDWSSGAMSYTDSILTIVSPSAFAHGETVLVVLTNYANLNGCSGEPESCSVIVDVEPPSATMIYPIPDSSITNPSPDIMINIADEPAGLDTNSFNYISVYLNGIPVEGFSHFWSESTLTLSDFSFAAGGTVTVCLDSLFDAPDYDYCPPNDTSFCWDFIVIAGNIVAYPLTPDDGEITACDDQMLTIYLEGTVNAVDEATILLYVDGTLYTIDSSYVSYDGGSFTLTFNPGGAFWTDDDTVCVSLWAEDIFGGEMDDTMGYCFITDFSPPYLLTTMPASAETLWSLAPSFSFNITDGVSGVESLTVVIDDSMSFGIGSSCVSWDGTTFSFSAECAGIEYPPDEDVQVCVLAWDSPDYCGPNELDTCWVFVVSRECSLFANAGADTSICTGAMLTLGGTPTSTGGTAPFSYQWSELGGSVFSTEENPTVSPSTPTYYVLVVTDGLDCTDSDTVFVDVHDCAGPTASFVSPTSGFTSCNPESIIINLTDPDGIEDSTIQLNVNGVIYTTDSLELYYSSPYLVFVPTPMWADGETVNVILLTAEDVLGNPLEYSPSVYFVVDLSPPVISSIVPIPEDSVSTTTTTITFSISDTISGADTTSLIVEINGVPYLYDDPCISIIPADCYGCFGVEIADSCVVLSGCDSVFVRVVVTDTTDYCDDNLLDTTWYFTASCQPPAIFDITPAESVWTSCFDESITVTISDIAPGVDSTSITISATDGGAYLASAVYGDAGLTYYYGSGELVWHPSPPLPPTGTITVQVSASDLLGNTTIAEWTFFVDRVPPDIAEISPPCDDTVYTPSPELYIIAADEGCGIDAVSASIGGVPYPVVSSGDTYFVDVDTIFAGGSVVEVCWHIEDCAGEICAPNSADTCCTFEVSGGGPYAFVHNPEDSAFVACSTYSVAVTIYDPDGILPESVAVRIEVDGSPSTHTLTSPEISYVEFADSIAITWTPPTIHDGMTVTVEVISACDSLYNTLGGSDVVFFTFDLSPPTIINLAPLPGSTVDELYPSICVDILDDGSGVDWSSVIIDIEGTALDTLDAGVSVDLFSGQICVDPATAGFSDWYGGDTIDICITAADSPDTCGPNSSDTCWNFIIASGGPIVEPIYPSDSVFVACVDDSVVWSVNDINGIDWNTLEVVVWAGDDSFYYTNDSSEVAIDFVTFAGSLLVYVAIPSSASDGDEITAMISTLDDSLGNHINPATSRISFTIDRSPPAMTMLSPLPDDVVSNTQPQIRVVLTDSISGLDIITVVLNVDGVPYTIDGSCLSYFSIGDSLIFDPATCGIAPWTGGDTIQVCLYAADYVDTVFCGANAVDSCWHFSVAAEAPFVEVVRPNDNTTTSCSPDTVILYIQDSDGVDEASLMLMVNGDTLTVADDEVIFRNDTMFYIPAVPFGDGDYIDVCLLHAADMLGNDLASPICFSFYVDYSAPALVLLEPGSGNMIEDAQQDVFIRITDAPAGTDSATLILTVYGDTIHHDQLVWNTVADGYELLYIPENYGISFAEGDTIWITLSIEDTTDYCADNIADTIWFFIVEPEVGCGAKPKPFTPNDDGANDRVVFTYPKMFSQGAELTIYDMRSHEVYRRTIGQTALGTGNSEERSWNGTDRNGNPLPQGVYVYIITVDGEVICSGTVVIAR